jgi:hypothetical protein
MDPIYRWHLPDKHILAENGSDEVKFKRSGVLPVTGYRAADGNFPASFKGSGKVLLDLCLEGAVFEAALNRSSGLF